MFFKTKSAVEQRDKIIAYKKTFSSDQGKQVLYDLMNKFHVLNAHDASPLAEGQRSVVLFILAQYGMNIEELDKLLKGN